MSDLLVRWIRERAARDFPEDLAVVLHYGSSATGTAGPRSDVDCCFVPRTAAGLGFARTFVIDGVGHDIFPISWERLEGIADLRERLEPLVGDSVVLHAASRQDQERLEGLRGRLARSLADRGLCRVRAVESLNTAAARLQGVLGSTDAARIRTSAGLAGLDLAHSVALDNGTYFHHGPKRLLSDLVTMPRAPDGFASRLSAVVTATDSTEATDLVFGLLQATATFLDVPCPTLPPPRLGTLAPAGTTATVDDPQALAHLYEEISASFVKVRSRCESGDVAQAALAALLLQRILDEDVPTEVALPGVMEALDPHDLGLLAARVDAVEAALLQAVAERGGRIERYRDLDRFIEANP